MGSPMLDWLDEHEMTITDVSGLTGLSVSYLSLVSRGRRIPSPRVKIAIARAVRARVGDLFVPEAELQESAK
jgi:transcriptional regulator with XRE-family HTH domain